MLAASLLPAPQLWAQSERERAGLRGPVSSVETYVVNYRMKDGQVERGVRQPSRRAAYDRDGNLTEQLTYDHRGELSQRLVYTFDAEGRPTGYEEYSTAGNNLRSAPRRHVYTLDGAGRRVEYRVYDSDGSPAGHFTYEYDDAGHLIAEAHYSYLGKLGGRTVYGYDGQGRRITQAAHDATGAPLWRMVTDYDEAGRATETRRYVGETLRYIIRSKYDGRGRVLEAETVELNAAGFLRQSHAPEPGRVVYSYDDARRTQEAATYLEDGTLKSRVVNAFDERGGAVGRWELNPDGSRKPTELHFYDDIYTPGSPFRGSLKGEAFSETEYDARGNWTKQTHLIRPAAGAPPQPYREETRVITYH